MLTLVTRSWVSLSGLTTSDIAWVFSGSPDGNSDHPGVLTFNFAPYSFGSGDYFRFSADTDYYVQDNPTPGDVFGIAGATFGVDLEG